MRRPPTITPISRDEGNNERFNNEVGEKDATMDTATLPSARDARLRWRFTFSRMMTLNILLLYILYCYSYSGVLKRETLKVLDCSSRSLNLNPIRKCVVWHEPILTNIFGFALKMGGGVHI